EFSRFDAFADPVTRTRIPDPQASSTFEDSRLVWNERMRAPHAGVLELYRALLRLRRTEPALQHSDDFDVMAFDDTSLAVLRASEGDAWLLVLCTGTSCRVDLTHWRSVPSNRTWEIVLTTEDARFLESDVSRQTS